MKGNSYLHIATIHTLNPDFAFKYVMGFVNRVYFSANSLKETLKGKNNPKGQNNKMIATTVQNKEILNNENCFSLAQIVFCMSHMHW